MKAKMKLSRRFFGILFIASLLMACSKEGDIGPQGVQGEQGVQGLEGPQGPAGQDGEALGVPGPQGEQGEQGVQGEPGVAGQDGTDGQDGDPGTANVIYSEWFNTQFDDNIQSSSEFFEVDFPEGNTQIMNYGVVLVFARRIVSDPPNIINALYQLPIADRELTYNMLVINGDLIRIVVLTLDGSDIGTRDTIQQYRYVVIPGGVASSGKAIAEDYTKMSYEEIAERFNIPD